MKRAFLFVTMFTGITNFAADSQEKSSSWIQPVFDAVRYYNKNNDDNFQAQMMGCDNYDNCKEHKITKHFVEMKLKGTDTTDLRSHINSRKAIWANVANRLLDNTGPKQIGDMLSAHTLQSIRNLLHLKRTLGSDDIIQKLRERRKNIKTMLFEASAEIESNDSVEEDQSPFIAPNNSPEASVVPTTSQASAAASTPPLRTSSPENT